MREFKHQLTMNTSPEKIWEFWMDVRNDTQWREGIVRAEWTSPPPYGVGSTGAHYHEKGGTFEWQSTAYVDGHYFEFVHVKGGLEGSRARFQVDPEGEGSLVTVTIALTGPLVTRIILIFMRAMMEKGLVTDLEKLKAIMENKENAV